jgi:hypothetical protein
VQVLWLYGLNLACRWRLRHIPGPRPAWLLGSVSAMSGKFMPDVLSGWAAQHGPVFRFFMGRKPVIVITGAAPAFSLLPTIHHITWGILILRQRMDAMPGRLSMASSIPVRGGSHRDGLLWRAYPRGPNPVRTASQPSMCCICPMVL